MIDKKRLDELQTSTNFMVFDMKSKEEQTEIIRLARIGLEMESYSQYVCCCGCGIHEALMGACQKAVGVEV